MFDLERNGVWNAIGPSGVKFFFICYNNYSLLVAVLFWFSVMISRNTEFKSWSSKAKFIIRGLLKLEGCFMWYTHDSDISNSNNGPLLSMHIKLIEFLKEILTISTSVTTLHKVKLLSVGHFATLFGKFSIRQLTNQKKVHLVKILFGNWRMARNYLATD